MTQLPRCIAWFGLLAAGGMSAVASRRRRSSGNSLSSGWSPPGSVAIFDVAVDPAAPDVRYQWRLNGGNPPCEIRTSLAVSNVQFSAAGIYTVVAYNDFGAATSDPAQLMLKRHPAASFQRVPGLQHPSLARKHRVGGGTGFDPLDIPLHKRLPQQPLSLHQCRGEPAPPNLPRREPAVRGTDALKGMPALSKGRGLQAASASKRAGNIEHQTIRRVEAA